MRSVLRKALSYLLVVVMLLGMIPATMAADTDELFDFVGSNMTLGNELVQNYMIDVADIDAPDAYTAIVTQNGETTTRPIRAYNAKYYCVSYGVAAKEMADEVSVYIVDENGEPVSAVYSRNVRGYAMDLISSTSQPDDVKAFAVDMLNYGASAQLNFNYNTDHPANEYLTEEQQEQYATPAVECANNQVKGDNAYGSNLSLEERILLNVFIEGLKGKEPASMYATVSFTDYRGVFHETTVPGSEFVAYGSAGDIFKIVVDDIVLADARQMVTVTVYNADGTVHGACSDSVESYATRAAASDTNGLYANIMKFATSAYVYLTQREKPEAAEKFKTRFDNSGFTYRIGNGNAVSLSSLFEATDEITGTVEVTVENKLGSANGTYTPGATWENGTIRFSGTGTVVVTITDKDDCIATELTLEVVDAVNATGAASATSNNVVLLKDCGFSSLEVSGGYTLYGNGFTMTCANDSYAADMGYSFVTLDNGTLDNVQIDCPDFDYAALYKSNLTSSDNRSHTDSNGKTRYYNARSGVMASGSSRILNCRISGARAAVNVSDGDLVIDNSRIEGGAVASVLVGSANSLTMRDVTLVQKPTTSTYDSTKTLMGFSVLYICDADGKAAATTLEGSLVQYAWVDEDDAQYAPGGGQDIISAVLGKTDYLHDLDGDGVGESLNLGFAYMPEDMTKAVAAPNNITDNRTDKTDIPYETSPVTVTIMMQEATFYVFSYKNTNGTHDSFKTESEYVPDRYGDIITVTYADTADGLTMDQSFGADGWTYELNVDLDKLGGYEVDFDKLFVYINGIAVDAYTVNGGAKPSPVEVTAGGITYELSATIDGTEYTANFKVTGAETDKASPSLAAADYAEGVCVASSYGGTWSGAAPALDGIQIRYWSVAEKQYKTIELSDYTPTTVGKLNGTNNTWTYSPDNGDFTLTVTGGQVHSNNKVSAMPVVVSWDGTNRLFFVAATSSGLVNTGNSARAVPVSYTFVDNNGGTPLTFSHTWSVAENKDDQYGYSDFCNGTQTKLDSSSGGGGGCVTPDTMVTLADGSQKRIDEVTYEDQLLVWDFFRGEYAAAPSAIIFNHGYDNNTVIKLKFSDGTTVKAVNLHQFFDAKLNDYVSITADTVAQYVGHAFVKKQGNSTTEVTLVDYEVAVEYEAAYGIISAEHYNILVEDMLSTDFMEEDFALFNYFEIGENMKFDAANMQADMETYGLYTYEDFADYLTYEQFVAFGCPYMKVSVGKGSATYEQILGLIETYVN